MGTSPRTGLVTQPTQPEFFNQSQLVLYRLLFISFRLFFTGHWHPETLEPRVEAPGHWNLGTLEPQVHREEKGHRPYNREWAPTRGTVFFFRYPLGSHWRSLRCAFHCRAAHGGYDVLGGARWLQVQFLVSLFQRLLRGGACPTFQTLCTGGALRRRHSQCARVAGDH